MTIRKIIENTKKYDQDIKGIKVAIQNQNALTSMGNDTELYFGELNDIPEKYLDNEIVNIEKIYASSDESRDGANVLTVALN